MHNVIESLQPLLRDIDSVKPDPHNARLHPQPNLEAIKPSLETYGQRKPIVVSSRTGIIEAGNGLWQAAKELGWGQIAAVMVEDNPETATGYSIMDNQSALLADWDLPVLKDILQELDTGAFDMNLTGFDEKAIEDLMTQFHVPGEGLTDDDEIPEQVETICKKGDLWQLGSHRLLCGDATKREDVKRLMGGEKMDAVITDPPYGIGREGIPNDEESNLGQLFNDLILPNDDCILIAFQSPRLFPLWLDAIANKQYQFGRALWWVEPFSPRARTRAYPWHGWYMQGEIILVATKGKPVWPNWKEHVPDTYIHEFGDSRVHENPVTFERKHPTLKPLWIVQSLVEHTKGLVYDPFGGSGSTMIACEKLGRRCFMIEIDEHYCDVIIQRWQNYTGKEADKLCSRSCQSL
ncbi:MAG: hypothetical protein A2Y91_03400 [Chloroflexi bacterium RBG_13_54_8]|nr:MAG: hypothetical protein A2Y91_03400 [Chloroflexi bacterium RBG_13_54_8]